MSSYQGKIAENIFANECIKRNYEILNPVIDRHGYDFVIRSDKYLRIQVKSTSKPDKRNPNKLTYKIQCRKGATSRAYEPDDFDYLAAYIIPLDMWYILPMSCLNKTTIRINPDSDKCKFKQYKEAWDLISG